MEEWKKPLYGPILGRKIVYISHGGICMKMRNKEEVLEIEGPQHLQCQHEEADTLLAFHANNISNGNILVSSSDTDVLIILLGLSGRSEGMTTILDYGSGNHRRYIAVAAILEEKKPGITGALIGFHALTGCDFPSCFFRKGKVRSFQWLEEELDFNMALKSLTSQKVDIPGVISFFCQLDIWIPNIKYRGNKIQSLYAHVQWYGKRTPGTNQKDKLFFSTTMH